jgi:hypothetical protein
MKTWRQSLETLGTGARSLLWVWGKVAGPSGLVVVRPMGTNKIWEDARVLCFPWHFLPHLMEVLGLTPKPLAMFALNFLVKWLPIFSEHQSGWWEQYIKIKIWPGAVVHICNLSTQQAELGGSSSRLAWTLCQDPDSKSKIVETTKMQISRPHSQIFCL